MDDYEKLIKKSKDSPIPDEEQLKLHKKMKRSLSSSKIKMTLLTVTFALLLVPTSFLLTLAYYVFGTSSVTLMDVTSQTLYITEPNTSLEEIEFDMDFSLFSMSLEFDQYKRIGSEDYKANTYYMNYTLGELSEKKVDTSLERVRPKNPTETNPWLKHPKQLLTDITLSREWKVLSGLPEETVVEAYISLNKLYSMEELNNLFSQVDILWAAVHTGVEGTNLSKDGDVVSPIGYPVLRDTSTWSPFNTDKKNEEVFIEILDFLVQHEELATAVSSHKNLALPERINYIKENGIEIYGIVVTGPKNELESLEQLNVIKSMKIGEVKLWNWAN